MHFAPVNAVHNVTEAHRKVIEIFDGAFEQNPPFRRRSSVAGVWIGLCHSAHWSNQLPKSTQRSRSCAGPFVLIPARHR